MKKIAIAAAVTAALSAGVAQAYQVGTFSNGFVVPNVIHNGAADTTAVGIISAQAAAVYWTFFDQNSEHVTDGCFEVTANDFRSFVWAQESGVGLEGRRGYLVFAADAAGAADRAPQCNGGEGFVSGDQDGAPAAVSANAFQVNTAARDVAFVPVIDGHLTIGGDLTTMGPLSLNAVGGAANGGETMYMRYFIDGRAGGDDTQIVVWSTGDLRNPDGTPGNYTVNIYDDAQNRRSVTISLANAELNVINPEQIVGRPADFTDGFITWATPATAGSVFSYSIVNSPAFGAVQTLLGAHSAVQIPLAE